MTEEQLETLALQHEIDRLNLEMAQNQTLYEMRGKTIEELTDKVKGNECLNCVDSWMSARTNKSGMRGQTCQNGGSYEVK